MAQSAVSSVREFIGVIFSKLSLSRSSHKGESSRGILRIPQHSNTSGLPHLTADDAEPEVLLHNLEANDVLPPYKAAYSLEMGLTSVSSTLQSYTAGSSNLFSATTHIPDILPRLTNAVVVNPAQLNGTDKSDEMHHAQPPYLHSKRGSPTRSTSDLLVERKALERYRSSIDRTCTAHNHTQPVLPAQQPIAFGSTGQQPSSAPTSTPLKLTAVTLGTHSTWTDKQATPKNNIITQWLEGTASNGQHDHSMHSMTGHGGAAAAAAVPTSAPPAAQQPAVAWKPVHSIPHEDTGYSLDQRHAHHTPSSSIYHDGHTCTYLSTTHLSGSSLAPQQGSTGHHLGQAGHSQGHAHGDLLRYPHAGADAASYLLQPVPEAPSPVSHPEARAAALASHPGPSSYAAADDQPDPVQHSLSALELQLEPGATAKPGASPVACNANGSSSKVQLDHKVDDRPATFSQLPAAPERTKTIAVASHCPQDIYTQHWTVDDFVLLKKLYEGHLSVVCQAQHKRSGRHIALKIYKRSRLHEMERFQLAREICLHIRILHPYIISLYAAWKDSKYVYLALQWAPQGNLFDYLVARGGKLPEAEAATVVLKPLLAALSFLHSQQFIHRDVKLENIVLDSSCNIKLADFGLAIDQKFEQANTRLGTFGYFAPEVLDCPLKKGPFDFKDQSLPGYNSKVDVWSAGVVAFEILTGKAPFSASSAAKILEAIRSRVLELPEELSAEAKDFLHLALQREPAARASAKQLLQHPWLQKFSAPLFST